MFDQLNGPLVLICGQNILEAAPKDKDPVSDRNFIYSHSLMLALIL
jgi:hypothetical protein